MSKYCILAAAILTIASRSPAIEVVDFQNGITELLGGGFYEGIIDTEFRSQDPGLTASLANNENISVDGEDGAGGLNETQSAIRFEGLVESGLLPTFVNRTDIRFASLSLWKNSPSEDLVNIEFHRVIGPDTFAGRVWEEDDSWADLAFDLLPTPTGRAAEFPFLGEFGSTSTGNGRGFEGDGTELAETPAFREPDASDADSIYFTGNDSEDIINFFEDEADDAGRALTLQDATNAFDSAFFEFDITEDIRDWIVDGEFNGGFVITNSSNDGWDFASSESGLGLPQLRDNGDPTPLPRFRSDQGFLDGETVIEFPEGFDPEEDLIDGLTLGSMATDANGDPLMDDEGNPLPNNVLLLDAEHIRPTVSIFFGDPADQDADGDADGDDVLLFLQSFGADVNGPLRGRDRLADLDFDGDVDPQDFVLFRQAFDAFNSNALAAGSLRTAAVPEPCGLLLAILACFAAVARKRRNF